MVGGQAVMEGVMMRTGNKYAVAVRKPNNRIVVEKQRFVSATKKNKLLGLPLVRGIIVLVETMVLGFRAMSFSARNAFPEEEETKKKSSKKKDKKNEQAKNTTNKKKKKEEIGTVEIVFTLIFSLVFALALFKFLPLLIASLFRGSIGKSNFMFNLIDGVSKLIILLAYIWLISLMKDVRRVFEYHGAEHKTVHCYEHNKKLTVKNVKKYSPSHPRCGTTFLLVVIVLSILFYLFIPIETGFWNKLLIRILFLPLIAGLGYEWIKLIGKYENSFITRILAAPGMLVQKLTTREPDEKQIEVAIKSLKAVT